jgi:AraC-like DNA-binding protein
VAGPIIASAIMPCPPDSANDFDQLQFHDDARRTVYSMMNLGHVLSPQMTQPKPYRDKKRQDPLLLRRLLRARDRMDTASHEAWPVSRLARASGASEAHFARSFTDAFGVPPHRYLLTRRIEQATALLRDTELPITEIALRTGWSSLGTFGRTFRDVTGESPSELRARERGAAHQLEVVPHCFVSAAQRPNLTIAVLEKRRRAAGDMGVADIVEKGSLS